MSKHVDKKNIVIEAIFAIGFFFFPVAAAVATTTMYFNVENPVIYAGDIFLTDLKISTPDTSINVVDGTILYDSSKLEIKEVSTGNSLLALWTKPPIFSNKKGTLSFVGGVSGGFQGEKEKVLRIIFFAKNEGEAQIDFVDGFSVFLHDGQGTQIHPRLRPLSVDILQRPPEIPAKDEWLALIAKDKTPPESFEITLAKDPSIFDNQYFISFFTTDAESGVAYYEVQEGERNFVRTESPYALQDQSLKNVIKVKAIDKAGNERIEALMPPTPTVPFYKNFLFWIILIMFIIVRYILSRYVKRKTRT